MMNALRRFWLWLRPLAHRSTAEDEMQAEMRQHLELATERLISRGMSRDEARIAARREFGNATVIEEAGRDARGLRWIGFSWMDVKVGVRRLRKHPVLNLAAIFALAVGIPIGLAPSHLARALKAPIPGDTDDRIRAIRYWDPLPSAVAPTWDSEFTPWARSLRSFSSLGAITAASYSVGPVNGSAGHAAGAQLTAAVFPMLNARPQMGRVLVSGDFAPGAPAVVVIGHDLWVSRFGRDPGMVGRSIRVGRSLHEVVGVMPEGFAFPAKESLWLPLQLAPAGAADERVRVHILGRLADGVSAEQAQAELSAQGLPPLNVTTSTTGADDARQRARLRPEVVPFGLLYMGLPAGGLASLPEFRFVQLLMFVLLLVACGNVAMLVFARTATRMQELAIRTALGASRVRLISQIFVETLLLAVIAAGVGVMAINWSLGHVNIAALAGETQLPWWLSLNLTLETALSAIVLAAVSATVSGVIPAVAITGRAIAQNVRGRARIRFGKLTGALVVSDIAISVVAIGLAFAVARQATDLQAGNRATGIQAADYLALEIRMPEGTGARLAAAQRDLVAALSKEPGVTGVAVADALPRKEHRSRTYELEGAGQASEVARWTRLARVDASYFKALGTSVLSGRDFEPADVESGARVAIVNTAFVQRALGGGDPLGRRVRFPSNGSGGNADWHVVVGVVGPLGVNIVNADRGEAVYLPAAQGSINPMQIAVHTTMPPSSLSGRVRELTTEVDADLAIEKLSVLSEVWQGDWYIVMGLAAGLVLMVGVLIALATSGLYAMLSLAVTERTREIGIRAALGASRRALLMTILKRSLIQIGIGVAIGFPLAARFVYELSGTTAAGGSAVEAMAVALGLSMAILAAVGLGSCLVPTRRILAVQASEAMRAEG